MPTRTRRPSTVASMPRPGMAVKRSTAGNARSRSRAAATIAAPSGCSLPVSAAATIASRDAASHWPAVRIRVTAGRPWVIVPVLSRTIAVSRRDCSSASPLPIRTPSSAALPVPTMTAVGVARPSAQGQAMISTAMAVPIAMVQWLPARPGQGPDDERGGGGDEDAGHEPRRRRCRPGAASAAWRPARPRRAGRSARVRCPGPRPSRGTRTRRCR